MQSLSVKACVMCVALMAAALLVPPAGEALAAQAEAKLSNSDCVKCHPQQPATIAQAGAKHRTEVGCLNCHQEHPPLGANAIPQCSMCHSGKPHYEIGKCGACHSDTHAPLQITFPEGSSAACVSCHAAEGKQMKEFPSAHSQQECTLCHPDKHRTILKCLECHGVHVEGQAYEECLSCHKPHMPKNIHYSEPANKVCAACHAEVAANLDSTPTKHHTLKCAYCHRDKHGMVPTCETCHGQPHPAAMHQKFPSCNQCHQDAHALVK